MTPNGACTSSQQQVPTSYCGNLPKLIGGVCPITPESLQRLLPKLEKVLSALGAVHGTASWEEAIALLREQCRDKSTSPAPWLQKMAHGIDSTIETDPAIAEHFYEILGLIDIKEKAIAVLESLPEDSVPRIDKLLDLFWKEILPGQRVAAKQALKHLPQRRSGGPKLKMPDASDCQKICDEINSLHSQGVLLGAAQKRMAKKWKQKPRMIEEIWRRGKRNS
jgi:hypothetical protein